MPVADEDKVQVVLVGECYYLADDWVAAYNTAFLELLERKLSSEVSVRTAMRIVRDMKKKGLADVCLQRTIKKLTESGDPITFSEAEMFVAARFPAVSDPPGKMGVD